MKPHVVACGIHSIPFNWIGPIYGTKIRFAKKLVCCGLCGTALRLQLHGEGRLVIQLTSLIWCALCKLVNVCFIGSGSVQHGWHGCGCSYLTRVGGTRKKGYLTWSSIRGKASLATRCLSTLRRWVGFASCFVWWSSRHLDGVQWCFLEDNKAFGEVLIAACSLRESCLKSEASYSKFSKKSCAKTIF